MIDITRETLLPLAEAAATLPPMRGGKRPCYSTIWRWATCGIKGMRLETIKVGSVSCTSREAMQRFFDRLTGPQAGVPQVVRKPPRRQPPAYDVEEELRKLGFR